MLIVMVTLENKLSVFGSTQFAMKMARALVNTEGFIGVVV